MEFDDEHWWDFDREEIHFRGRSDSGDVLFRLTQIAINDHFQSEDTREVAESLFIDNRGWFEDIATAIADDNEGADLILITGDVLRSYAC